ncbi:MAG TPA: glucosamine-6-phosphate deaminase [Planctomycetota bacterium]|nr:glucosamine-6-phosphate deaminase [Planctomycetota bacterium]
MIADPAKIPLVIHDDHTALAQTVAKRIAALVKEKPNAVLGLPTGSTPKGIYKQLVILHKQQGLDLSQVRTFNLDEYYPMKPDAHQSYHRFMNAQLFRHVNIKPENIHIPKGDLPREQVAQFCADYEGKIKNFGGIDLQILGIGRTGHIGFNEPGTPADARTRLVRIHPFTRRDAAADFFGEENVPTEAITMGTATILSAREIILVALGENKASIIQKAVEGPLTVEVPASLLQGHKNATVHLDHDSAAELMREKTPWRIAGHYEFKNDHEKLRAIIWLSFHDKKPIQKLSQDDYVAQGLASLAMDRNDSDEVNRKAFHTLLNKVRDHDRLPKGERQILFSPHPDDDVISAGGIFRKMVENGNEVFVAYQTSGNIAVFDHDVQRYMDFVEKHLQSQGLNFDAHTKLREKVDKFLESKKPGQIDIPEVGFIKRFIREAEAISGAVHVGIKRDHCVFMNLPFYQTGAIEKDPPGEKDINQTLELLNKVQPQRILAAGDLSDPHGTHRVCLWIIREAVQRMPKEKRPIVWLYRGAWQEWPLDQADILVPLTERELSLKIEAIFKHQSQKDRAMFPGPDEREFWQRVVDRNTDTARRFYQLGLPYYHALEAYVEQNW